MCELLWARPSTVGRCLTLMGLLLVLSSSAWAQEAEQKITFDDDVQPILRQRCAACHSPDKKSGGLDLTNFTNLMLGGSSGGSIEPGDSDSSYLFMLVNHDEEPYMPPGNNKIPEAEIKVLKRWINGGALETKSSKANIKRKSMDLAANTNPLERPAEVAMLPRMPLEPILVTPRNPTTVAIATSPWTPLVAIAGTKQILLYNTQSLDLVGVLDFPEGKANVLRFSRNGQLLLAGGGLDGATGKVVLWDVRSGRRTMEIGDELDTVLSADISADHSLVALGGPQKVVRVYSTQSGQLQYELRKHTDWITAVSFSPDGVLLATGDRNGGLFVWEAQSGNDYLTLAAHTARVSEVSWRMDSNVLASSSEDATVRMWEMENGGQIKNINAHPGGTLHVSFGRSGHLVSTGRDRTVKWWNPSGDLQKQFNGLADLGTAIAFCNETNRVINADLSGQVSVWQESADTALAQLGNNPPTLAMRLQLAQTEQANAETALQPLQTQLTATTDKLKAQQSAMQEAVAVQTKWQTDLTATESSLVAVRQVLEGKTAQHLAWQSELTQLNGLTTSLTELATKAQEVAKLAAQDADLQSSAQKLSEKLTQHTVRVAELNQLVTVAKSEMTANEQQMQTLTAAMAEQQKQLAESTQRATELAALVPAVEAELKQHTDLAAAAQAKLEQARQLVARWQDETQFIVALQTLKQQLAIAEQEAAGKLTAEQAVQAELVAVQERLAAAEAARKQAEQQAAAVQTQINQAQGIPD